VINFRSVGLCVVDAVGVVLQIGSFNPLEFLMRKVAPIQTVVLHHEQNVKQDGEEAESKLCRVPKDGTPVVVVVADEEHLQDGEGATREVEEDVADAPADRALPPVVHVSLWNVLDQRNP